MSQSDFVRAIEAALGYAIATTREGGLPAHWDGIDQTLPDFQSFCRRAALQLLDDLDGTMLLDLALSKLDCEKQPSPDCPQAA